MFMAAISLLPQACAHLNVAIRLILKMHFVDAVRTHTGIFEIARLAGYLDGKLAAPLVQLPAVTIHGALAQAAFDYISFTRASETREWIDAGRTARSLAHTALAAFVDGDGGFTSDYFTTRAAITRPFSYDTNRAGAMFFYEATHHAGMFHLMTAERYAVLRAAAEENLRASPRMQEAVEEFHNAASCLVAKVDTAASGELTREGFRLAAGFYTVLETALQASAPYTGESGQKSLAALHSAIRHQKDSVAAATRLLGADETSPSPSNTNEVFVRPSTAELAMRADMLDDDETRIAPHAEATPAETPVEASVATPLPLRSFVKTARLRAPERGEASVRSTHHNNVVELFRGPAPR
jgi:hypothetical protein